MQRQKLPQEIMAQKLQILVPNAKCDVRPFNNNAHLVPHIEIRGDMLINWLPENGVCPSLEAIQSVTQEQINAHERAEKIKARHNRYADDLGLKAAFRAEKVNSPNLTFTKFLDDLEAYQL